MFVSLFGYGGGSFLSKLLIENVDFAMLFAIFAGPRPPEVGSRRGPKVVPIWAGFVKGFGPNNFGVPNGSPNGA